MGRRKGTKVRTRRAKKNFVGRVDQYSLVCQDCGMTRSAPSTEDLTIMKMHAGGMKHLVMVVHAAEGPISPVNHW